MHIKGFLRNGKREKRGNIRRTDDMHTMEANTVTHVHNATKRSTELALGQLGLASLWGR